MLVQQVVPEGSSPVSPAFGCKSFFNMASACSWPLFNPACAANTPWPPAGHHLGELIISVGLLMGFSMACSPLPMPSPSLPWVKWTLQVNPRWTQPLGFVPRMESRAPRGSQIKKKTSYKTWYGTQHHLSTSWPLLGPLLCFDYTLTPHPSTRGETQTYCSQGPHRGLDRDKLLWFLLFFTILPTLPSLLSALLCCDLGVLVL